MDLISFILISPVIIRKIKKYSAGLFLSPPSQNMITRIAHRGFSACAPENTLAAFSAAVASGAKGIEFDVRLSADGIPVIIHDPTVDRTTNGKGNVAELSLQELQSLDAGFWFAPQFEGLFIPSLSQVFELLDSTSIELYIEIKDHKAWKCSYLQELVTILFSSQWHKKSTICCFRPEVLEHIRTITPHLKVAYSSASLNCAYRDLEQVKHQENAMLALQYSLILDHPLLWHKIQDYGVEVVVWTVDDRAIFQQLVDLGVQKIITNALL